MNVLVTGARGMIGSGLVRALLGAGHSVIGLDRAGGDESPSPRLRLFQADLADGARLREIIDDTRPDRFIHLAALAHTHGESDLSWERYYHVNVECSKNLFELAGTRPVLFISTIDVYGFFDGKVPATPDSPLHPVSLYGKSKVLAEAECRKLPCYDIFRLSPVYTPEIKRDIQKRYYLKPPWLAYRIGRGSRYEVLDIRNALAAMVAWCGAEPTHSVRILKDAEPLDTAAAIREEKAAGRAKFVLPVPRWAALAAYRLALVFLGRNNKTFLLNKAVHPLRTAPDAGEGA